METTSSANNYFDYHTQFDNVINAPWQGKLIALATLVSYLTVIFPVGVFFIDKAASLAGRIWPKTQLSDLDSRVNKSAAAPIDAAADIVVIGGGPVGLWTAIQMKARTNKNITIVEKYNEYQRAEIRLNISASSLKGIPDDPVLKELVKEWGNHTVPIKSMEEALAKRANELGIKILKGHAADPKLLPSQFPAAKLFVGADGARSLTREHISGDEYKFNTTQQHIVQVQYIIDNGDDGPDDTINKFRDFSEKYRMQKFAGQLIAETITPQEDGTSKVTLQIFVDKDTFDKMQDASFKTPYYFKTHLNKIPDSLRETLIKWWGAQEEVSHQVISQSAGDKNKMTVIALGSYAAKNIVKSDENGKMWTLVGDAAAAFPFFRAINNGFLLGTELARCTAQAFERQQEEKDNRLSPSFFNNYSRYATLRVYAERIVAAVKNFFIKMSSIALKIGNALPLQIFKYGTNEKDSFYSRGVTIWTKLAGSPPTPRTQNPIFSSFMKKATA